MPGPRAPPSPLLVKRSESRCHGIPMYFFFFQITALVVELARDSDTDSDSDEFGLGVSDRASESRTGPPSPRLDPASELVLALGQSPGVYLPLSSTVEAHEPDLAAFAVTVMA
jgi:hypothetical protein